MAAKLNLRRGSSFTNPSISEPFFNTNSETLEVGYGTTTGEHFTLTKLGINTGSIEFTGDITASNAHFIGNTTVDGNIYLGGDIFLGDGSQATDNINVNATFSGSIVPVTADVFDLGAEGKYWNTIFALTGSFGNGIISGSSQLTNEFDLRYLNTDGDSVVSGSSQINITQTPDYVTGIKTRLDAETVISGSSQVQIDLVTGFTTFSSSVDGRLDSLETTGLDVTDRLDSIEATTESFDGRLNNIELTTQSFDGRLGNIESFTSSYFTDSASVDSRLDTIEGPFSTSLDNRLDLLESFSSSLDDTFVTTTELHTATSSLSASLTETDVDFEGRIYTLETTFSSSVDNRIDLLESFSSSLDDTFVTEIELNSATSSLSASLTETDVDFEGRINTLETTFSSSVDSRLDVIEGSFSQSVDSRLDVIEGSFSQSVDSRLDDTESTGSEHENRLDNIELYTASLDNNYEEKASGTHTLFSGSSQVNADTIANFDSNVKTKLDLDNVVSSSVQITISSTTGYTTFSSSIATTDEGQNDRLDNIELYTASVDSLYEEIASGTHTLVSGSSQIQIDSVSGFTAHSSSVDSRLDSLEGDSHTHSNKAQLDVINQDLSNTSNVTFNDITASGNVIVSGDLTVLGTATEIQTSELVIKDKLITIASGSTNSAEADGSGIEIDGAGKSIIWDDATQSFILNAKVSSSVGFKGDGSELENVTASDVEYANVLNKPTLVSGSSQISYTGITDKPTLVSGSSQIDHDTTTNFVANEHIDHSTVSISAGDGISGGGNITATRTLTLDTGSVHFKDGVKEKLNEESVISGSSQILGGTGILSSSNENFTQFSSSIDSRVDTLEGTFSQSVDSRLVEIFTTGSDHETRIDEIETTFSSSVDTRLDSLEVFSSSLDSTYEEISSGTHTLVSGSSQIDVNSTQNFTIFSQSVDSRLDAQEAFSESLDSEFLNTNGDNVVSGSTGEQLTASLDLRYEEISSGTNTLVSGSSQVDVTQTTNIETLATTGSNSFIGTQTITGSVFITGSDFTWKTSFTENFPTEVAKDIILFENFIGSDGITYNNNHLRLQNVPAVGASGDHTLQLNFGSGYGTQMAIGPRISQFLVHPSGSNESGSLSIIDNGDKTTTIDLFATNVFLGSSNSTISINGSNIYTDTPISSSNYISASFFIGDGSQLENIVASEITYENISGLPSGLVSGSSQIDVTQTTNYSSIRQYDNTDNTTHLNSLGVVSGSTYSSPSQGTLRTTINGTNTDVDLGLQSTDTPTFNSLTASNLPNHDNTHFDAVFKGTSGEFGYRTLATAAFYHVSNSIDDGNPLVLGNAGAVKSYVDDKIIAASSGDITEVNAGPGLGGGSTVGAATLNLDTGSQHFIDGVTGIAPTLPSGLVSGSDQVTSSLDTRYVNVSGDTVTGDLIISGDLTVNGTTTTINTTNINVEDNIIELNFGGSATNGGLLVKDSTGGSTTSGSLLWDGTNDYWIAGISGSENRILTTADNVITDSNINTNVVEILNNENVHSGSYLGTATTSNLTEGSGLYYTNVRVKTKLDADGVISGSSQVQINSVTGFTTFSGSVDTRIDSLESFSSSLDAGFVTEVELNTATQSLQDSIDLKLDISTYTPFSTSVDSRLDGLEGVTSENPLTFTDTSTIDFTRVGDVITADVIGGVVSGSSQVIGILDSLNTYTSSNDTNQTTQNGRLTALEVETGSISTEQSIQDGRLNNLESYTASVDSLYEEKASGTHTLVSGSSQIDLASVTNNTTTNVSEGTNLYYTDLRVKTKLDVETVISGSSQVQIDSVTGFTPFSSSVDSRIISLEGTTHTHANKANLDTINQNLSTTSNVIFNDIVISGTGSFGSNVTVYGDLTVLGTETIINTTNLAIADNMIYLNSGSTVTNPDLGWAGNYNDGTYAHAGLFRDASDGGTFKVYEGYTPEPEGSIDTTHASFALADFQANAVISNGYVLKNSGGSTIGTLTTDGTNVTLASGAGLSLLTTGGTDGVIINANGDTTIYGALALQDIPVAGTSTSAFVVGASNVVSQRTLGTNAFDSTDNSATYEEKASGAHTLFSGSSQVNADTITNFDANVLAYNNSLGVVSGSSQITITESQISDLTHYTDADVKTKLDLETVVSGSSQITKTLQEVTTAGSTTSTTISITNTTASTTKTTGALVVTGGIGTSGDIFAGGDVVAYASSDRRLKDNILPIENPLQKINSIGGYSFDWNVEKQHIYNGKDYGVIAQEIEEILPELVQTRENGYKAVKYDKLVSLLIEGIKELSQEVNELKQQINK